MQTGNASKHAQNSDKQNQNSTSQHINFILFLSQHALRQAAMSGLQ